MRVRPASNCKENSTHDAWRMLDKEQILRKRKKELVQDVTSLLSGNYSKIILVLLKGGPLFIPSLTTFSSPPSLRDSDEIQC